MIKKEVITTFPIIHAIQLNKKLFKTGLLNHLQCTQLKGLFLSFWF